MGAAMARNLAGAGHDLTVYDLDPGRVDRTNGLDIRRRECELGMTGNYTHTRPETQRTQIEQALRRWPDSLCYAIERVRANGLDR